MTSILLYFGMHAQSWWDLSPSLQLGRVARGGHWPASWALGSIERLMRKHAHECLATGIVTRRAKTPAAVASIATRVEPGPKGSP